jgi:hypothetical protein
MGQGNNTRRLSPLNTGLIFSEWSVYAGRPVIYILEKGKNIHKTKVNYHYLDSMARRGMIFVITYIYPDGSRDSDFMYYRLDEIEINYILAYSYLRNIPRFDYKKMLMFGRV